MSNGNCFWMLTEYTWFNQKEEKVTSMIYVCICVKNNHLGFIPWRYIISKYEKSSSQICSKSMIICFVCDWEIQTKWSNCSRKHGIVALHCAVTWQSTSNRISAKYLARLKVKHSWHELASGQETGAFHNMQLYFPLTKVT